MLEPRYSDNAENSSSYHDDETIIETLPSHYGVERPYQHGYTEEAPRNRDCCNKSCSPRHLVRNIVAAAVLCAGLTAILFWVYHVMEPVESSQDTQIAQQASAAASPRSSELHKQQTQTQQRLDKLEEEYTQRQEEFQKFLRSDPVAQAMISESNREFALWSKGRFSVSDIQGKNLYFEVDPTKKRSLFTGDVAMFGALHLRDALEAQSAVVRSSVLASSFATEHFSVDDDGSLSAKELQVEGIISQRIQTEQIYAEQIEVAKAQVNSLVTQLTQAHELQVEIAQIDSLELKTLKASGRGDFDSLHARELELEVLRASDASLGKLQAQQARLEQLYMQYFEADDAFVSQVKAVKIQVEELEATQADMQRLRVHEANFESSQHNNLHAAQAHCDTVLSDSVQARSISADELSVKGLSVQKLDAQLTVFKLSPKNFGELIIPAPQSKEDLLRRFEIVVPENSYAIFLDCPFQESAFPAQLTTQHEAGHYWIIARYAQLAVDQKDITVKWLALSATSS